MLPRTVSTALLAAVGLTAPVSSSVAQTKPVGLVIVAHGADSSWNSRVRQTVEQVKWEHGPVRVAFLMGNEAKTASWDSAATQLERQGVGSVVVVPFMISSYGSHTRQIQFYAGKLPSLPKELEAMAGHDHHSLVQFKVPTVVTPALDDAPELGQILAARWKSLSEADRNRPLVLIAHGPDAQADVAHWESNILSTAKSLRDAVSPRPMRIALLRDDAPAEVRKKSIAAMRDTITALATAAKDSVMILPVLISTGGVNNVTIPTDIAGLPVRYSPVGLAPHAGLSSWISRVAEAARKQLQLQGID